MTPSNKVKRVIYGKENYFCEIVLYEIERKETTCKL